MATALYPGARDNPVVSMTSVSPQLYPILEALSVAMGAHGIAVLHLDDGLPPVQWA